MIIDDKQTTNTMSGEMNDQDLLKTSSTNVSKESYYQNMDYNESSQSLDFDGNDYGLNTSQRLSQSDADDSSRSSMVQSNNESISIEDSEKQLDDDINLSKKEQEFIKPYIGTIDDAEEYQISNHRILTGYRIAHSDWKSILWSIFAIHNETSNIWSHLIGFVLFLCLLAFVGIKKISYTSEESDQPFIETDAEEVPTTKFPLYVNTASACFMLLGSTLCHWLYPKSKQCGDVVTRIDYAGIAIMIMGSSYPFICYKFACGKMIIYRWWFLVGITVLSLACFIACMTPQFMRGTTKAKALRGLLFMALGLATIIVFVFLYVVDDVTEAMPANVGPYALGGAFYIFGAMLYVLDIPERYWPKKFDIIGSGHNIFHCCVVAGAIIHFVESWKVYQERLEFVCPAQ